MASSMTLPSLQGPQLNPSLQGPQLKSHFLGRKILPSNSQKPCLSVPKKRSRSYPVASAKFNLFEILGGRGLCNGEKGIEEELKKSIEDQKTESSSSSLSASTETVQSSGSQESSVKVPEDGFDKELMGLTGGFPGGEAGLRKFIEENPPPPKKAAPGKGEENLVALASSKKVKAPELPLLMPGMIAIVKNPNNPFYMYCGIVQRITDGRAGVLFEGGNWDRLVTFRLEELERREKGPPEKGLFYALDLGGTNFRVLRVQLGGKEECVIAIEFEQISIPQELMSSTSEELFDFIASGLAKFEQSEDERFHLPGGRKRELGFTFSFPVKQTSIDSGILMKWTKGFSVSGTAGRDVVACLNEAMERQGLDMRVSALVNDTVGTLAGARYWDDDVMVAVILGTGTNACYIERMDAISKLEGQKHTSGRTIINTEWGAFSNGLPLTVFDKDMDAASINPGEQIYEKTISGMYLGENVRRVLLKMAEAGVIFGKSIPDKLSNPFALRTPDLCAMQQDNSGDLQAVGSILYDVVGIESNLSARKVVVDVCDTIVKRGGRLAGAGIVGILQKMEEDSKGVIFGKRTVVAMDGGLYEHYPQYREYLQGAVTELLGDEKSKKVVIQHSKDGSGIGAALLAAANSKYEHDC